MPEKEVRDGSERRPFRVRLPIFVNDADVGLGDVVRRVTYGFGFNPCRGCERRASALNRFVVFSGWRPK
jgi:hypothetical protein